MSLFLDSAAERDAASVVILKMNLRAMWEESKYKGVSGACRRPLVKLNTSSERE